jgi:hypothetical protein
MLISALVPVYSRNLGYATDGLLSSYYQSMDTTTGQWIAIDLLVPGEVYQVLFRIPSVSGVSPGKQERG